MAFWGHGKAGLTNFDAPDRRGQHATGPTGWTRPACRALRQPRSEATDIRIAAVGDLVFADNAQINRSTFKDFLP